MKNSIFKDIPKELHEELFDELLLSKNMRIERIVSQGHSSPEDGWYDQNEHEWVILIDGEATISFVDSKDVTLKSGEYLNIPAHMKHRVSWSKPEYKTVWLAIFYK